MISKKFNFASQEARGQSHKAKVWRFYSRCCAVTINKGSEVEAKETYAVVFLEK